MRLIVTALLVPLLLAACASGREPSPPLDGMIPPATSKVPGASPGIPLVITGRLGLDDIEGGCAYLEADDGTRYEVIYPAGWTIDRSTGALTGPDGQSIVPGELVRVSGAIATDRSSICQLGPIFVAVRVLPAS